jgi:hypothetical protein
VPKINHEKFTRVIDNGSKWLGQEPDSVEPKINEPKPKPAKPQVRGLNGELAAVVLAALDGLAARLAEQMLALTRIEMRLDTLAPTDDHLSRRRLFRDEEIPF